MGFIEIFKNIYSKDNSVEYKIKNYKKTEIDKIGNDFLDKLNLQIKNNAKDLYSVNGFEEDAVDLWQITEQSSKPLLVMIMGEFKTGKSTFINNILGEVVLKSDVTPATAVITMVNYGKKRKVLAHFFDGSVKKYSFKSLADITVEGDDSKKELRNNLKYVEIFLPLEFLKKITIVDTPGLNVDNETHIKVTKEFMSQADTAFWVFSYGKAASRTEVDAIKELSQRLKPIAIINRIDEIDEEEESLEEVIEDIKRKLKEHVSEVIGVSSLLAQKSMVEKDEELFKQSKWNEFIEVFSREVLNKTDTLKQRAILDKLFENVNSLEEKIYQNELKLDNGKNILVTIAQDRKQLLDKEADFKKLIDITMQRIVYKQKVLFDKRYAIDILRREVKQESDNVYTLRDYLVELKEFSQNILKINDIIYLDGYIHNYNKYFDKIDELLFGLGENRNKQEKLSSDFELLKGEMNIYNKSGMFGNSPIFDFSGRKKELKDRDRELLSRRRELNTILDDILKQLDTEYRKCIIANKEVQKKLKPIKKLLVAEYEVVKSQINSYETNFDIEKGKWSITKNEIKKADDIIDILAEVYLTYKKLNC